MTTSRKQRESDLDLFAKGSMVAALFVAVMAWWISHSLMAGVVVFFVEFSLVAGIAYLIGRRRRRHLLAQAEMFTWESWEEFESSLCALFSRKGYRTRLSPNGNDFGADLVLEKDSVRTVVQAKHWRTRDVGVKAVQEVSAAKAYYRASEAIVVTTSRFTQQARDLARVNMVELWDRDRLAAEIGSRSSPTRAASDGQMAFIDPALVSAPYTTSIPALAPIVRLPMVDRRPLEPTCPRCGTMMVQRSSRYGDFWGCGRYPDCRGTRPA